MDTRLNENTSIYVQIMDKIRAAVAAGELKTGEKIQSVRQLAADFEVNPNTMQRALAELEREGILESERTAGRFVTADKGVVEKLRSQMAGIIVEDFYMKMKEIGYTEAEIKDFFLLSKSESDLLNKVI